MLIEQNKIKPVGRSNDKGVTKAPPHTDFLIFRALLPRSFLNAGVMIYYKIQFPLDKPAEIVYNTFTVIKYRYRRQFVTILSINKTTGSILQFPSLHL